MVLAFSDLSTEVYQQLGLDSSDSTVQSNVTRWLNYCQQDLCARWPWPFMEGRESIVTIKDYTTGTVSVSSGGTTVTGVGTAFTTTHADGTYYIQFSGSNDWYKVTARTSATSITIENAYAETTNLSGGTFIIRKFYYSLSSSCDRIVTVRNWESPIKLVNVDVRTLDGLNPNPQSTNTSYAYICWQVDASGNIMISPYPFPSDARELEFRTIIRPTDGVISIPNKYAHVIAWAAMAVGYGFLRKLDMAAAWERKVEQRLMQMRSEYRMSEDKEGVLRSIDSVQRSKWIAMPDDYPAMTSG